MDGVKIPSPANTGVECGHYPNWLTANLRKAICIKEELGYSSLVSLGTGLGPTGCTPWLCTGIVLLGCIDLFSFVLLNCLFCLICKWKRTAVLNCSLPFPCLLFLPQASFDCNATLSHCGLTVMEMGRKKKCNKIKQCSANKTGL